MEMPEIRVGSVLLNDNVRVVADARTIFDIWNDNGLKKYTPVKINIDEIKRCRFRFSELGYPELSVCSSPDLSEWFFAVGTYFKKIEYLHQLQNLYYDFTGKDLVMGKPTIDDVEEVMCSLEISSALKDLGFNLPTSTGYTKSGKTYKHQGGKEKVSNCKAYDEGRDYIGEEFFCSKPSLSVACEWVRKNFGIDIWSSPNGDRYRGCVSFSKKMHNVGVHNTPQEAQEKCLQYVLKKLIPAI